MVRFTLPPPNALTQLQIDRSACQKRAKGLHSRKCHGDVEISEKFAITHKIYNFVNE
jgi:hypothetical protein